MLCSIFNNKSRLKHANKRKETNVEFYNGIVVNKDIDTDKDIDKVIDRDIEKDKSKEEPVIDEAKELERLKEARKHRKAF